MNSSLERLLKEVGIVQNSETKIKDLEIKIGTYVAENARLLQKAQDLDSFGFINTPTLKNKEKIDAQIDIINAEIKALKDEITNKKTLEETIAKYAIEYPSFKFIPRKTMIDVMKKYDLVLGETCVYSKEIPNLALDILNGFRKKIKQENYFIDARFSNPRFGSDTGPILTYFSVRKSESVLGSEKKVNYIKSNLKIIAPESHFENRMIQSGNITIPTFVMNEDTREYEINLAKLNELVRANTEVLDPILCLEVDEGYIVLHAWDEEAHIPEIKNTLLN
jgi:hypothetical protein